MEISNVAITTITPYPANAKKHDKKQIGQIANSIAEFGFNQPIVVDQNNVIIVGHGRYEAAREMGMDIVPVMKVNLTEEQANAYRLADNKLNESPWDMDLVIQELKGLDSRMIDLTGFSRDLIIDRDEKEDEAPSLPESPFSQLGDVYEFGGHRLVCGDSTKPEDIAKLMNGQKADMIFTDPPYNVNYSGRGEDTSNTIENDNMDTAKFTQFLTDAFASLKSIIKPEGGVYICYASRTSRSFETALETNNFEVRNQIIWVKLQATMGWGDYRWKHELLFYCHQQGNECEFYGDRKQYTEWDEEKNDVQLLAMIKKMIVKEDEGNTTVWKLGRDSNYKHPTQKPVQLCLKAICNSSQRGQIVGDIFMGSGSTLIACEKSERKCYGMELDPKYIDVIIQRWCDYTGNFEVTRNGEKMAWVNIM